MDEALKLADRIVYMQEGRGCSHFDPDNILAVHITCRSLLVRIAYSSETQLFKRTTSLLKNQHPVSQGNIFTMHSRYGVGRVIHILVRMMWCSLKVLLILKVFDYRKRA